MANLTPFGKAVRRLRLERDEMLKDMADKLGMSSAYLFAIELGRKNVPDSMINKLVVKYSLKKSQLNELRRLVDESRPQYKLSKIKKESRELVASFARKFNELNQEQITKILKLLNKGD